jgi:multimeric flavodoxin WrbA
MADAVLGGARDDAISGVEADARDALATTPEDVRACDGIILGTPENFGYMSGAMKMFFETIYYPCLEHTQGLPYALFIRAGTDGHGAESSMQRIITGLRWREVSPAIIVAGEFEPQRLPELRELGMVFAAGLESGIF